MIYCLILLILARNRDFKNKLFFSDETGSLLFYFDES